MPKVRRDADVDEPRPEPRRRPEAPPAGPSRGRRAVGWLFTPSRLLMLGLVPLCAALAPWTLRRLPDLSNRDEYRLTVDRVRLDPPPPAAVPPGLAADVLGDEPASILERDLAGRLAAGFAAHPWVAGVDRVEVLSPAAAVVRLTYRVPVAAVEADRGLYPVDVNGTLLPPADFTRPAADALPRVSGVGSRPGPAGTLWPDPAVTGAAAVCAALADDWDRLDLAAVRPLAEDGLRFWNAAADDEPRFELLTRAGSRVLWGRRPGTEHPGELGTETKRTRLVRDLAPVLAGERTRGALRADLTAWDAVYHAPLRTAGRVTPFAGRR